MRTYVALTTAAVAGATLLTMALTQLWSSRRDDGSARERARAAQLGLAGLDAQAKALAAGTTDIGRARAAAARAIAHAIRAAGPAPDGVRGPATGRLEVPDGVVVEHRWLRSDGTISATVGAEWVAAAARVAEAPTWAADAEAWAVDAEPRPRVLVRLRGPAGAPTPDTTAAASGLVALLDPTDDEAPLWPSVFAGALVALLMTAGVWWRVDGPVRASLDTLVRWQRGEAVGPVPVRGGWTARALAQVVASTLTEVERRSARAHEQVVSDAHRLATAMSAVAQGDLAPSPALVVAPPLAPIAGELSLLRAALSERVLSLYQAALAATRAAHEALGSEHTAGSSTSTLSQTVVALEAHATAARAAVAERRASTEQALVALAGAAEHLRRAGRELRAQVEQLARRAAELAEASERLSSRAAQTVDADEGLELLVSVASVSDPLEVPGGGRIPASHAQATARRGRAALAELRREAESTAAEHASIARELTRATEDTGATIREAPPQAVTVVREAIGAHLTAAERAGELMGTLAQALARLDDARASGAAAAASVARLHAPLAHALVGWDLGDESDRAWLTPAARADEATTGLDEVLGRVAAARQRIDALVREVEEDADRAVAGL